MHALSCCLTFSCHAFLKYRLLFGSGFHLLIVPLVLALSAASKRCHMARSIGMHAMQSHFN